jgi:DNA polymerase (family 10)
MELHGENSFKIRSYTNAYLTIRKLDRELAQMNLDKISDIEGIGKAISTKIIELIETGEMATLNKYKQITPAGIQDLLTIKGFGPKKIKTVWKELGVETAGELLNACRENRLVKLKGFGLKTQAQLIQQLEYFLEAKGKYLYANVIEEATNLIEVLIKKFNNARFVLVGELARKLPVVSRIEILTDLAELSDISVGDIVGLEIQDSNFVFENIKVQIHQSVSDQFGDLQIKLSSSQEFLQEINALGDFPKVKNERDYFSTRGLSYILPEIREDSAMISLAKSNQLPVLIDDADIKGVIHNHSTYSDGLHTLKEMADHCKYLGYSYFVISDHSKSAFYANGLSEDRLYEQWSEIDQLNAAYGDQFKVYKSIESDILNNGDLDYDNGILEQFDLVIASIHSNLRMDEHKATHRLIKAIENPYTRILGHPTGRLLLSRKAYPIDHKMVIDACADNNVEIEINANPYRLDLDWTWVSYAMEKGILISINPDAHSKSGINDIHFGICVARKAGLTKELCLNTKDRQEFEKWIISK